MNTNVSIINHNSKFKKKKPKYCNNCNTDGHNYKECTEPITSYGIICYQIIDNVISYLIIRRRNSFAYTDFLRALRPKQHSIDVPYISLLLSKMTHYEHDLLRTKTFEYLWDDLWLTNKHKHEKDYKKCKKIFECLSIGKTCNGKDTKNLRDLIKQNTAQFTESEWGFPKGKRNAKESDIDCAKREFMEETGIDHQNINVHTNIPPLCENYKSYNNKDYRTIYYIAKYIGPPDIPLVIDPKNKEQYCEVDGIKWGTLVECHDKFRHYYISKCKLINSLEVKLRENYEI